jgi:hypothetical protein
MPAEERRNACIRCKTGNKGVFEALNFAGRFPGTVNAKIFEHGGRGELMN